MLMHSLIKRTHSFKNTPTCILPASALGDSMDQLSQRSSSERTQFMSREDLDQEGSIDLDHDQYHYQDQDQDQYTDHELEPHEVQDRKQMLEASPSTPPKTLELKVQDKRTDVLNITVLIYMGCGVVQKNDLPIFSLQENRDLLSHMKWNHLKTKNKPLLHLKSETSLMYLLSVSCSHTFLFIQNSNHCSDFLSFGLISPISCSSPDL